MLLLLHVLTALVVYVAGTADSAITGGDLADVTTRLTSSAFPRTPATHLSAQRLKKPHENAVLKIKHGDQFNEGRFIFPLGEEIALRVGVSRLIGDFETTRIVRNIVDGMQEEKIVKGFRLFRMKRFVTLLSDSFKSANCEWNYGKVVRALTPVFFEAKDSLYYHVAPEDLVDAFLLLREEPGMKAHADLLLRSLLDEVNSHAEKRLFQRCLALNLTPEAVFEMLPLGRLIKLSDVLEELGPEHFKDYTEWLLVPMVQYIDFYRAHHEYSLENEKNLLRFYWSQITG
ncbi:unnamed protein product [Hyaloperonospora brassicae]|uniref:RxLR effector candidate protein n=1 Tax=Hyaloperonospora brassicae TaxID=162125 RepID=A0AAV0UMH7_HYABA|nr:unnamed protein product [Hyaloperonospora brassicae]